MPDDIPDQQLRNEWGVRATHPPGAIVGDRYTNDGTGALAAGYWWLGPLGWLNLDTLMTITNTRVIYVDKTGNDANQGTVISPLLTGPAAVALAKTLVPVPDFNNPVAIVFGPGLYTDQITVDHEGISLYGYGQGQTRFERPGTALIVQDNGIDPEPWDIKVVGISIRSTDPLQYSVEVQGINGTHLAGNELQFRDCRLEGTLSIHILLANYIDFQNTYMMGNQLYEQTSGIWCEESESLSTITVDWNNAGPDFPSDPNHYGINLIRHLVRSTPIVLLNNGAIGDDYRTYRIIAGANMALQPNVPGPGDLTIDSTGGGAGVRDERPDDYTELHTLPDFCINGNSGQRCNTILADGRELFLWVDNFAIMNLTVVNPFYSDLRDGDRARHTRVYPLDLRVHVSGEPLFPPEGVSFCITCEEGEIMEGEMIHIVMHLNDTLGNSQIYDAYFPSAFLPWIDLPGQMNNNPGDPGLNLPAPYGDGGLTPNMLLAERVNFTNHNMGSMPVRNPSVCADPFLMNGSGVAVVWSQQDADNGVWWMIWSNFYCPMSVVGSRYNILQTGYIEGQVSLPGMVSCDFPTVECSSSDLHCSYTDAGDDFYSNTPSPGIFAIPPAWDVVGPIAVNLFGAAAKNHFVGVAPSMCVFENLEDAEVDVVLCIMDTVSSPLILWSYLFDTLMATGVPTRFFENRVDVLDASKNDNTSRYQMGASDFQFQSGVPQHLPKLYIYRTINAQFTIAPSTNMDYILSMKPFAELRAEEGTAWENITLFAEIGLNVGLPYLSPKVNYSHLYNNRGWQNASWSQYYPLNNFFIMKIQVSEMGILFPRPTHIASEFVFTRPGP